MSDNEFKARFAELAERIKGLPASEQARLAPRFNETSLRHEAIHRHAAEAHSALDDWRVTMKYLIFDREASAREQQA